MTHQLDIILPMYNPQPGWEQTVLKACRQICDLDPLLRFRVILVNDGSTQTIPSETISLLEDQLEHFTYLHYAVNKGKGFAVRKGAAVAKADHVIFTDIDFPYREEDLLQVYQKLKTKHADLVLSVREDDYYQQAPWMRSLISRCLKFVILSLFRIPNSDTQGGLKGFSTLGLQALKETEINRYLFDLELVKRASFNSDLKIEQVKAKLKPEVVFSQVGLNILWKESMNLWRILILKPK